MIDTSLLRYPEDPWEMFLFNMSAALAIANGLSAFIYSSMIALAMDVAFIIFFTFAMVFFALPEGTRQREEMRSLCGQWQIAVMMLFPVYIYMELFNG